MNQIYTKEDIIRIAHEEGVRYIRLQFTDLLGTLKNVEIPLHQLEKALDNELLFDGSSIEGYVRVQESDMYLHPDLNTWLIFPWSTQENKVARLICDVCMPNGTTFAGDPRGILKRVLKKANTMGFSSLKVRIEPEFFLLKLDKNNQPTTQPNDEGGYFDMAPIDLGENCRREIALILQAMGIEIETSHHEAAPGQHEIDLKFADAVETADNLMTFKLVVKTISRHYGLHATFMPKPFFGMEGSGMHFHHALFSGHQNVFYNEKNPLNLSEIACYYASGILAHARAITAVTNPLVNSYKRLVPGYEAPVYAAWSSKISSHLIRVSVAQEFNTSIEVRSPDPSCNPYLAIAVMLMAGLDGIENKAKLPLPINKNIHGITEEELLRLEVLQLPLNLEEALEALDEDEIIQAALGEHAYTNYVKAKSMEWDLYRKIVHQWELKQYLYSF
ncbi:type I glutamate--ammonia ligase [Fodinisporobacter ferrooxydans]|uniref:Glutamine synthetase n=1 Tax=Fodinisporobacter ferrooxydans TaxID=2901836 RepID=A0ABY4CP80_9BACL|nr:type I glutamate--ammonia ligase [Alicyclobacillaceae bacterium MYW30-H2]